MTTEQREPTLADIINRLDRIDTVIQDLRGQLDKTDIKFDAYVTGSEVLGVVRSLAARGNLCRNN
jgi:hypothetical protein